MSHNMTTPNILPPILSLGPMTGLQLMPELPTTFIIKTFLSIVAIWAVRRTVRTETFTNAALRALRIGGPIPGHIAFIMDGNRRWARRLGLPASEGHPRGGDRLIDALQWCLQAGVHTVTVFAFSIENFKRSEAEVNELMALAHETVVKFSDKRHILHQRRVRVRILGDMSLLPVSVRTVFARIMNETRHFLGGPTLNICFSYAARHDITTAVRDAAALCADGRISVADVNADLIAACLSSGFGKGAAVDGSSPSTPDLLVRTSGETRLSDFMLWEATHAVLSFHPTLWPDFSAWDFMSVLLDYQRVCRARRKQPQGKLAADLCKTSKQRDKVREALQHVRQQHFAAINEYDIDAPKFR